MVLCVIVESFINAPMYQSLRFSQVPVGQTNQEGLQSCRGSSFSGKTVETTYLLTFKSYFV